MLVNGKDMTMADCCLKTHPEFGGCCCKCRYRLKALGQPGDGPILLANDWACIAFAFMEGEPTAYIGDFEHGMCELFEVLPWPRRTEKVGKLLAKWRRIRERRVWLVDSLYQVDCHVEAEGHRVQLQLIGLMDGFIADLEDI